MKKNAFMIIIMLTLSVVLFSCKDAKETIKIINELPYEDYSQFSNYTDSLAIPHFLSEPQAELYKKAAILHYIFTCAPSEIDSIPLLEGQEKLETQEQTINGIRYYKSVGRYRKYADFEELCLSVFTREVFDKLNSGKKFIPADAPKNQTEDLYISAETEIVQMSLSYAPWNEPDTFELISSNDTEVKFTVTGYYFDTVESNDESARQSGEITHLTIEITMVYTENGWRFSQFATAGNPYNINQ